jgi:hypothetical protein
MRVSDSQRQRVIEELRRHCVDGRIDVDDYTERVERAMSAATLEELDKVLGDLPYLRIPDPYREASPAERPRKRLVAALVVLVSVVVVVAAVVLAVAASWVWAVVLVAGWLLGQAQARLLRSR